MKAFEKHASRNGVSRAWGVKVGSWLSGFIPLYKHGQVSTD